LGAWLGELGRVYADITGIRDISYRVVSDASAGRQDPNSTGIAKLWWSEAHQRLADLGLRVAGAIGRDEAYWYRLWLESRAETIYAGASEIQRNIISERLLGLPR
jgi:alkylation response protein AidB-like acyl-CoA dehydrogenase